MSRRRFRRRFPVREFSTGDRSLAGCDFGRPDFGVFRISGEFRPRFGGISGLAPFSLRALDAEFARCRRSRVRFRGFPVAAPVSRGAGGGPLAVRRWSADAPVKLRRRSADAPVAGRGGCRCWRAAVGADWRGRLGPGAGRRAVSCRDVRPCFQTLRCSVALRARNICLDGGFNELGVRGRRGAVPGWAGGAVARPIRRPECPKAPLQLDAFPNRAMIGTGNNGGFRDGSFFGC